MLEAAKQYCNLGYNVIPVNKDKKALVKWESFQKERSTISQIEQWFKQFKDSNIGIVTGEISNLFVIDSDTPESTLEVQNYLPENIITPIQITPHNGKHFFFKHIEGFSNRARVAPGIDIRTSGGYIVVDPSVNGDGSHWKWIEGLSLQEVQPIALPDALLSYIKEYAFGFNKETITYNRRITTNDYKMFKEGRRDEDIFHTAYCLINGGMGIEEASQVINILAQNCIPQFPIHEAQEKLISAIKRAGRRERNITQDIRDWVTMTTGDYFETTSCYKELQLTTKEQRKAAVVAFVRLKEEGIIESYGNKRGSYRVIETNVDEIDFLGIEEQTIDIKWPFEVEKWVSILPKNIIVIAGESNAGKTAFLLNTCFMNMGKFKINYFSSEMGAMELRKRLKKFGIDLKHWKENINFRERSSNFADVIKPNDLNIVDFLEITDEFYKVGGMIKEIYDKLKKGIAIIALQKNPGTDFGLGGMRSIEKARLYLSIESGKIKIVKGKNWASETNPNGIYREFSLIQGAKFIDKSDWKRG